MSDSQPLGAGLPPWLRDYVCGAFAGGANVLVGYPFDTVKVGGFFVGVSAPLIGGALECGVNYLTYTSSLHALAAHAVRSDASNYSEHRNNSGAVELERNRTSQNPCDTAPLTHIAAAAAVAGVTLSFVLSPVELVKCRLQVNLRRYRNPIHCLRLTIREEGARGLLRGLGPTLAREVPGNALFFTVYEAAKRSLLPHPVPKECSSSEHELNAVGAGSVATKNAGDETVCHAYACRVVTTKQENTASNSTGYEALQHFATTVAAGGIAGCAMWGSVLPIDSAKTRIQAARPGDKYDVGLLRALKMAWIEGGMRSWWAGLGPTLFRAFPANAAQWLAWEASLQLLS